MVRKIGDQEGWDRSKRRDFQNDALIALTARHYGATIVTADYRDFELLARELRIAVLSSDNDFTPTPHRRRLHPGLSPSKRVNFPAKLLPRRNSYGDAGFVKVLVVTPRKQKKVRNNSN